MKTRSYQQVDVFTDTPYLGNALAVVLDAQGLSHDDMQNFARWTNLSETTFLLKPSHEEAQHGADYALRIFTPAGELPFAGHPTLGSCHAWLRSGGQPRIQGKIVQACKQGLINIQSMQSGLAFAAPPLNRRDVEPDLLAAIAAALGIEMQHIEASQLLDNGPRWLGLVLDSAKAVLDLEPDHAKLQELGHKVGVIHLQSTDLAPLLIGRSNREARAFMSPSDYQRVNPTQATVRAFAAPMGVLEDPVTGSLNASLAQWLMETGQAPAHYLAIQGERMGRYGQLHIHKDTGGQVWVGGSVVTCIEGSVML